MNDIPKNDISSKENNSVLVLATLFVAVLILSNLTGAKIASIQGFSFNAGILFFPLTYIISDVLTEVYGFKMSRKIIWCGFAANLLVALGLQLILLLPAQESWPYQEQYMVVYGISLRILAASMLAYLLGEYVNAYLMAKMKIASKGRNFWYRALGSTAVGKLIDSSVFNVVALLYVLPLRLLVSVIITQYVMQIIIEAAVLPFTYKLVAYLKKKDNIDYYDYRTNFSLVD